MYFFQEVFSVFWLTYSPFHLNEPNKTLTAWLLYLNIEYPKIKAQPVLIAIRRTLLVVSRAEADLIIDIDHLDIRGGSHVGVDEWTVVGHRL